MIICVLKLELRPGNNSAQQKQGIEFTGDHADSYNDFLVPTTKYYT